LQTTPACSDDQAKAFRKAARDLGRDDNEERFEDALRTVAKAKRSGQKVGRDSTSKDHGKLAEDGE
jgi:hypothetical protein